MSGRITTASGQEAIAHIDRMRLCLDVLALDIAHHGNAMSARRAATLLGAFEATMTIRGIERLAVSLARMREQVEA